MASLSKADLFRELLPLDYGKKLMLLERAGVDLVNARSIGRLVLRCHRLKIETGAWTKEKTPKEQRLCNICRVLENELHFIFHCVNYSVLRDQYINYFFDTHYANLTDVDKLKRLYTEGSAREINNLGLFIRKAMKTRGEIVRL